MTRADLPPPAADYVAGLEAALDNIRELNMTAEDQDGNKWSNSDLIEQEVVFALAARPASPDTRVVEKWDDFRIVSVSQLETLLAFSDHRGCTMIRAILEGGQDRG